MPKNHCWYRECKSDSRYNDQNLFYFIPFPKPCVGFRNETIHEKLAKHLKHCEMCKKAYLWLCLCYPKCGTNLANITRWSCICSLHFVGESGPTQEYPDPIMYSKRKKSSVNRGGDLSKTTKRRRSTVNGIESIDDVQPVDKQMEPDVAFECKAVKTENIQNEGCNAQEASTTADVLNSNLFEASTQTDLEINDPCCSNQMKVNTTDNSTQTMRDVAKSTVTQTTFTLFPHMHRLDYYKKKCQNLQTKLTESQETEMQKFENTIKVDRKKCIFYTGLVYEQILVLLNFLGPAVHNLKYRKSSEHPENSKKKARKFTPIQQMLLVLIRLCRGFLVTDLAYRFGLSPGQVSKLTTTWIQLMYLEFNSIRSIMFASRKRITETLPATFNRLKNIRVIVDCVEFFCESPLNYEQQGNLHSQCKAHTTFKVLIGCTPNGAISYVSDLFEGSMSDREVFEQCGIIDLLEPEDLVLADRGFTVNDLVQSKGATLNIPPFVKGRERLTPQEEIETKKIAKGRIYVEHIIGRLKKFRLLQRTIPLNMRGTINQIVFVCACLVNFGNPIVME